MLAARGLPAKVTGLRSALRHDLAAARGEDDANRHCQRREQAAPGYPKGGSGRGAPAGSALKWRLKCLSIWVSPTPWCLPNTGGRFNFHHL